MQDTAPLASAYKIPRRRSPVVEDFFERARASMTGRIPRVERAWLCVPDNASPISLAMIAQTPQESSANTVHRSQRGISRLLQIPVQRLGAPPTQAGERKRLHMSRSWRFQAIESGADRRHYIRTRRVGYTVVR